MSSYKEPLSSTLPLGLPPLPSRPDLGNHLIPPCTTLLTPTPYSFPAQYAPSGDVFPRQSGTPEGPGAGPLPRWPYSGGAERSEPAEGPVDGGPSAALTQGVGGLLATRWGPGAVRGADADAAGLGAGGQVGPPRRGPGDRRCAVRGADAGEARPSPRLFTAGSPAAAAPATAEFTFDRGGRGGGGGGRRGQSPPRTRRAKRQPPDSGARPPERSPSRGQRLGSSPAWRPRLSCLPFPLVRAPGALLSLQRPPETDRQREERGRTVLEQDAPARRG